MGLLQEIGEILNCGLQPVVYAGGLVMPRPVSDLTILEGGQYELGTKTRSGGPEARQRQGAAAHSTAKARAASGTGSLVVGSVSVAAVADPQVDQALSLYEQFRVRATPDAIWMRGWVRPIADLNDRILLVVKCPTDPLAEVQSWAWWHWGFWIGPRHTYLDGSICAFEKSHRTWLRGRDPLWQYLDLAVVWSVRQLHLAVLGTWPGRQVIHSADERVRHNAPTEFCGCDSGRRYRDCHQRVDHKNARGRLDPLRRVPTDVLDTAMS
jgi:hypothetical protein